MVNTSELILKDRENRYIKLLDLSSSFKQTILCARINYPGQDKRSLEASCAFGILKGVVTAFYKDCILYFEEDEGFDGSSIILVLEENSVTIKKAAISIEETHKLGRLFDIDVLTPEGIVISRQNLSYEARRCIICDNHAQVCAVKKTHHLADLLAYIHRDILIESLSRSQI